MLIAAISSPGGSPAHSEHIFRKLKNFASGNGMKLLTFAEDVAASGGYYVLTAGKILASFPKANQNHRRRSIRARDVDRRFYRSNHDEAGHHKMAENA